MAKFNAIFIVGIVVIGALLIKKLTEQQQLPTEEWQSDYYPDYTTTNQPYIPMTETYSTKPASVYTTSPQGRNNIVSWEGRSKTAYKDVAGNMTIGIGHLIRTGDGLSAQSVLSDAEIDNLFAFDLSDAENSVKSRVIVPLTQGQFDALVDFVFNLGDGAFAKSTLLLLLNQRQYDLAAAEFTKWVHAGNQVVQQLVARRNADTQIFYA